MGIMELLMLLGSAAAAGSTISKNNKIENFNEQQTAKQQRKGRRDAMLRAINARNPFAPDVQDLPPSTTGEDILGAIGGLTSGLSSMKYGQGDPAEAYFETGKRGTLKGAGRLPNDTAWKYNEFGRG